MKSLERIIGAVIILLASANSANSQYYFYSDGVQELYVVDSLISVKFDPEWPSQDFSMFPYHVQAIDENMSPRPMYVGLDVYHLEDGHDIDSLIQVIEARDEVQFAFPVFEDTLGFWYFLNEQFVLKYRDTVTQSTIDSIEAYYNVDMVWTSTGQTEMRVLRITSSSPQNSLVIANLFYESGLVEYSHPDFACAILNNYHPADPLYFHQYYLYNSDSIPGKPRIDIQAEKAWEITMGSYVTVAIIDDGFATYHEDIDDENVGYQHDYVGPNPKIIEPDDDARPGICAAHGVACQGIIMAKHNDTGVCGIAPQSALIGLKCWSDGGSCESGSPPYLGHPWNVTGVAILAQAIQDAASYGARVISNSWSLPKYFQNIVDAIDYAQNSWAASICVFSVGNDWSPSVMFPARLDNTIAVGAVRRNGERWDYSNYGPEVDLVAPSGLYDYENAGIYTLDQMDTLGWNPKLVHCDSTDYNYMCEFGGTSAACAEVAGVLSLVRSRRLDIRNFDTLKMVITQSAHDQIGDPYEDTPGHDNYHGYGLVSAYRALLSVIRGDMNNDGAVDVLDIAYWINAMYKGGPPPQPDKCVADLNCDGLFNLLDGTYLINYIYKEGPEPLICFIYEYESYPGWW